MKKCLYILFVLLIFSNYLESHGNRKAMLIGIHNYENYAPLRGCHGDVESMSALLKMSGFKDDYIWIVKDDFNNPMITASNMYSNIMAFSRTIQQGDKIIFFFSGHGIGDRTGENYLLGYDGNMDAPQRFSVSVNEIKTILKENNPAEIVLIIDACRDYVVREGRGAGQSQTASLNTGRGVRIQEISSISNDFKPVSLSTRETTEVPPTVIKTIYAASEGQKSFERRDRNHGIFTYYLTYLVHSPNSVIDVDMSRNGIISIEDLVVFADNRIQNYVKRNNLPKMNPVYQTEGAVSYTPFLLFRYNPEPVAKEIKNREIEPIFKFDMEKELEKIRQFEADLSYLNDELPLYNPRDYETQQFRTKDMEKTDLTSWQDVYSQQQEIDAFKAEEERKRKLAEAKRIEYEKMQNLYNKTISKMERTEDLNEKYYILEDLRKTINTAQYVESRHRILPLLEPAYKSIKEAKVNQDRELLRLKPLFIKDLNAMKEMKRSSLAENIKESYLNAFKNKWIDYVKKVQDNSLVRRFNDLLHLSIPLPIPLPQEIKLHLGQGVYIEMILVQAGKFIMGSSDSERGRSREYRQHEVKLTENFYIGKYPVTQKQWQQIMRNNPSYFKKENLPVESVSWNECQEFIRRINMLNTWRNEDLRDFSFRLPTEAQWEYVARGGNKSKGYIYSGSNDVDEVAWHRRNSQNKTQPVGKKKSNELGVYDMSGNVWEWCLDWFGNYPRRSVIDPTGRRAGRNKVLRGGGFNNFSSALAVCFRFQNTIHYKRNDIGFRLVLF